MINYLLENKDWIFSGVGVSAVAWMLKALLSSRRSSPQPAIRVEVVQPRPSAESDIRPGSEVTRIRHRFIRVLALMNENRVYRQFTIAGMAQCMKLRSVGELESIFLGDKEPSFEFIEEFCATFGINKNWLIEGKETPFRENEGTRGDPLDYLHDIQRLAPSRVYFVRSISEVGEVFLVLKFSDWKYKVIGRVWHISDHVGEGGRSQILGMYQLILALKGMRFANWCGGRILKKDQFSVLLSGEVFPGAIIGLSVVENHWWDDFVDVHHRYPISANYESLYGAGFMAAQYVVRSKLEEQNQRRQECLLRPQMGV